MSNLGVYSDGRGSYRLKLLRWHRYGKIVVVICSTSVNVTVGSFQCCSADLMTQLFDITEIFAQLDPYLFFKSMEDGLLLVLDIILNDEATQHLGEKWRKIPDTVKNELVLGAFHECPEFMTNFLTDFTHHIHDVLDVKQMCIDACIKNKEIINKIFEQCGQKEFRFIRRSGFYFGFIFGCIQTGIWLIYDGEWMLPVGGFLVGWLTNWIALKIIFRPLYPKRVGPLVLQGLFLKRQPEVAVSFAHVTCVEILNTETMWESILNGPKHKNFQYLLRTHALIFTEHLMGGLRPLILSTLDSNMISLLQEDIASKVVESLPSIIELSFDYTTKTIDLETIMCTTLKGLPPEEYEGVLHPAFEEDELTLILVGGVLGLLVGVAEVFMFRYA